MRSEGGADKASSLDSSVSGSSMRNSATHTNEDYLPKNFHL